jgi:hypothetical protein
MYVDDGAIMVTRSTHCHAAQLAAQGFEHMIGWLARNGLHVDHDKIEFILFDHLLWSTSTHGAPFTHLDLHNPDGTFSVPHSPYIHYLGMLQLISIYHLIFTYMDLPMTCL